MLRFLRHNVVVVVVVVDGGVVSGSSGVVCCRTTVDGVVVGVPENRNPLEGSIMRTHNPTARQLVISATLSL